MDKEQAIELLEHLAWDRDNEGNCYGEALQTAIDALRQPEIVHCKDCVNYHDTIDKETGCLLGIYMCDLFEDEPPADWYCADGIRRVDDVD